MIEIKDKRDTSAGQFFTVSIDGTDIKDCKVVDGSKGTFVSGPSRKDNNGKWWPQVYFSEAHKKEILTALLGNPPEQGGDEEEPDYPF